MFGSYPFFPQCHRGIVLAARGPVSNGQLGCGFAEFARLSAAVSQLLGGRCQREGVQLLQFVHTTAQSSIQKRQLLLWDLA